MIAYARARRINCSTTARRAIAVHGPRIMRVGRFTGATRLALGRRARRVTERRHSNRQEAFRSTGSLGAGGKMWRGAATAKPQEASGVDT